MSEHLVDFRDRHRGQDIVVCGCGASLKLLERPGRFVTIGVNDVGRLFTPDYLVVVNERRQFAADRYVHVERSQAKAVFSQLELAHPRAVRFRLGRRGGVDLADPECLHYSSNSPYVAVNLARHLGARRIGLIGIDFDDDHFFGRTGRHPLAAQLPQIEREYAALAEACRAEGVELVNLSPTSRLESLPRASLEAWADEARSAARIFFVHYRFLSCGTVFETGLREAAQALGVVGEHADWDDARLPQKVERFKPDLLFVVHGRRFVQRWGERIAPCRKAVWLLDEPYEVDDTAAWSGQFDVVFVNDAASLGRHRNAHELPVAYAPGLHCGATTRERRHRVGFIGGANPTRESMLSGLAERGLLDYVVGGPWREARLGALCLASNVPAERTAALYRDTAIVVNVFRDRHHYNRAGLIATAMNPRIYEALACGALALSEPRDQLTHEVPELPTFASEAEAAALIERFLADPGERLRVQHACAARLADATYAQRLRTAMDLALDPPPRSVIRPPGAVEAVEPALPIEPMAPEEADRVVPFDDDWDDVGAVARNTSTGEIIIDPGPLRGPGAERGLTSRARFDAVDLALEACLEPGACLLAKVHQADRVDQTTNSYHLLADERRAYLARHQHLFRNFESPGLAWVKLRLLCQDGVLSLWLNDRLRHRVRDRELTAGYVFVGTQGGRVRLRGVRLAAAGAARAKAIDADAVEELRPVAAPAPRLSILTTVYDRTECLRQCIASVRRLAFRDYEHIIVADHPSADAIERIGAIVAGAQDPRVGLFNLKRRHNNWGIAPAAAGLRRSRGEFISFLSDDNGYTSDHVEPLIRALDGDPALGFVYSSCQYDGRLVLSHPVPRPGRIDLGQPIFRRELFELYLGDDLPFDMMAWDWHLIDTLMRHGVRWRHVNRQSFIFRMAKYPHLIANRGTPEHDVDGSHP
jgi:Glycosyl transferase family 2/Glycosyl transferases group 1